MPTELSTLRAGFDSGVFFVRQVGSKLPPQREKIDLLRYLTLASQTGWRAIRATFEEFTIIVDLERGERKQELKPVYLLQALQLSSRQISTLAASAVSLKAPLAQQGWTELGSSHPFMSPPASVWLVTLWIKDQLNMDFSDI